MALRAILLDLDNTLLDERAFVAERFELVALAMADGRRAAGEIFEALVGTLDAGIRGNNIDIVIEELGLTSPPPMAELVRIFTTIGPVERLTPVRLTIALRINAELVHGAFAVKSDNLIMVDTMLLTEVSESQLASSIRFLAETADYYEKAIFETDEH